MRDRSRIATDMEKEFKPGQMVLSMKASGSVIKCVVKVASYFPMETYMKVPSFKIWPMVKELSSR